MEHGALPGGDVLAVAAFLGYLIIVLAIGVSAARFSSSGLSEFFIGGRRMHRFVIALSAVASGRSGWLLLGVTGMAYTRGASAVWTVTGYILAELLLFVSYAPRLRRFSEAYDRVTLPDFFAARSGDRDDRLRVLLAAVILFFMVGYVAVLFGIALASILAAIMSTADSQLLVAASVLVRDLDEKVHRSDRVTR